MTITYTTKINSVKVKDIGEIKDVVKQVNFVLTGTEDGLTFELPNSIVLDDPEPTNLVPFASLTQAIVEGWVETHPQLFSMKGHIALVLEKMVEESRLKNTELPWSSDTN